MNAPLTTFVCGMRRCLLHEDGQHRWTETVSLGTYDNGNSMGESVACKCGQDAFSLDLMGND